MIIKWITELHETELPSFETREEIIGVLESAKEDIARALLDTGEMSFFIEINGWFLQLGISLPEAETVIVHHFTQNEWLDMINLMDEEGKEAGHEKGKWKRYLKL